MKTLLFTALAVSTFGAVPSVARAEHVPDVRRIDRLALELEADAARACREVYYHFRGAPDFHHLYSDTYELYTRAAHIHELAHHRGGIAAICREIDELDELAHHTAELVDDLARDSAAVGFGGRFGHGHSSSDYHLRRLRSLVECIEETVHELADAVHPRGFAGDACGRPAGSTGSAGSFAGAVDAASSGSRPWRTVTRPSHVLRSHSRTRADDHDREGRLPLHAAPEEVATTRQGVESRKGRRSKGPEKAAPPS
ncbi:MAG: hypothetical protein KY476_14020 [Planctomycetes bacterium]|nr:hypothetical protein [Planctomycetota bacterium]